MGGGLSKGEKARQASRRLASTPALRKYVATLPFFQVDNDVPARLAKLVDRLDGAPQDEPRALSAQRRG